MTPRPAGPRLHLETLPDLESAAPSWQRLAARCPNPFSSYEWAVVWCRHYGGNNPLVLALCTDETGREVALLPMHRSRGLLRVLRFVGSGPADVSGPVCADSDAPAAAHAVRALLDETPGWDLLLAERMAAEVGWSALLGARTLRREPSPVLAFGEGGWEGFLATKSRNFRQQVRRHERRLASRHGATFRLSSGDRVTEDMRTLFRLHALRWGESTQFLADRAFHEDFAQLAHQRAWLRLWLLEIGDVPVAAWYGLRYADQEWYYQAGRDPLLDSEGVGAVLLAHTVRAAADDGVRAYRFLRGGEGYKARFSDQPRETETLALGRGAVGSLSVAAASGVSRMPSGIRSRVRTLWKRTEGRPTPAG